eukprot:9712145-Lingulodinium_polyedra.AAC.1
MMDHLNHVGRHELLDVQVHVWRPHRPSEVANGCRGVRQQQPLVPQVRLVIETHEQELVDGPGHRGP